MLKFIVKNIKFIFSFVMLLCSFILSIVLSGSGSSCLGGKIVMIMKLFCFGVDVCVVDNIFVYVYLFEGRNGLGK